MSKLSEKEIINIINKLKNIYYELKKDDVEGHNSAYEMQFEDFEAIQGLLDLYQKEKEKNLIFKGATIVSDLKNDGIEMKMNADKLIALYLEEKEKNKIIADDIKKFKLEAYILGKTEENETMKDVIKRYYIRKDKIKEIIYPTPTNPISHEIQSSDMYRKILQLLEEK